MTFEEMKPGMKASSNRLISRDFVHAFGRLVGDLNPMHMDADYGKNSRFGQNIAHGMIGASLISAMMAGQLPGPGSVYMKQDLVFLAPTFFDDTLTTSIEILETIPEKRRVILRTWCEKQTGEIVIDGKATAYIPE